MLDTDPTGTLGFQIPLQQIRQHSINLSIATSANTHLGSYQFLLNHFKKYTSNAVDMVSLHESPLLKLKKYKEAVYYGEYESGHRQGQGIMLYHNGQKYQGQWRKDQREGKGFEQFPNNSTYLGEYQANQMHGQGKYTWPSGAYYEGEWQHNLKHGTGLWLDPQGQSYLGEWTLGQASGIGVYNEPNSRYEGEFLNFVKHGQGTEKFASGDLYRGQYASGKFEGKGEYYWRNGSHYLGQFRCGLREGQGVWRSPTGEKYEGAFVENKREGYGILTWPSGEVYKGQFVSNMRQGRGEVYWTDGSFYKGLWAADQPHGLGQLFDGQQLIKGLFRDGQLVYEDPQQSRKISEFYLDPSRPTRTIGTPASNHTSLDSRRGRRLVVLQVAGDNQVRQIKPNKKHQPGGSLLRRKLMETLGTHKIAGQAHPPKQPSNSQSREKVLHSSFQIHRLHHQRQQKSISKVHQRTVDAKSPFAFAGGRRSLAQRYGGLSEDD